MPHPEQPSDEPSGQVGPEGTSRHEPSGTAPPWEEVVARFRGPVGEVDDPLTWGLDLDEETLTGIAARDTEPVQERFLRSYLSFAGETVDVETLRVLPDDDESAIDVVRTSLSAALAAPLQGDTSGGVPGADDDAFVDSYAEYRAAMRAIVEEVEAVTPERVTFVVDGAARECLRLSLRTSTAVLVTVEDRALVVAGPRDLLDRVDVVTRPLRSILHGET